MAREVFYFLVFFHLVILGEARTQTVTHELEPRSRSILHVPAKISPQSDAEEDSSSSKINAVPIVAFGLGGFILGGIIGAQIDQGGPFEITKTERTSMVMGTAVGVTFGYILAKRKQGKSTVKMQR